MALVYISFSKLGIQLVSESIQFHEPCHSFESLKYCIVHCRIVFHLVKSMLPSLQSCRPMFKGKSCWDFTPVVKQFFWAMLAKPTNKDLSTGVPTLSMPCSAISLSTDPNRFYPDQQRLQSRQGLTRGVQGRAVRTEFPTVGEEDMGIWQREIITYAIII